MRKIVIYVAIMIIWVLMTLQLSAQEISFKINVRGVYESRIALVPLTLDSTKPIADKTEIRDGDRVEISIPDNFVPGEFLLRIHYIKDEKSSPQSCERHIFISGQSLEMWTNPRFCNHPDSSYLQKLETENTLFAEFMSDKRKEDLHILQGFLLSYRDTTSEFYQLGLAEYEKNREEFNKSINELYRKHDDLFVSRVFPLHYIPKVEFSGTEEQRLQSVLDNYFDGINFDDTLIVKTSFFREWMNNYVNLYGSLAITADIRDSVFAGAGVNAIEKAKQGHPLVYGWMVDYFFNGFEAHGLDGAMKSLEPYINDPNCLTSKRREIQRRLTGIETIAIGTKAPNIIMKDVDGKDFNLHEYETQKPNILLAFWAADCNHCAEMVNALFPIYNNSDLHERLDVIAISLDDSEDDIELWKEMIESLEGWRHLNAPEGVNSKVANDYFLLSTPVFVILNTETKVVKSLPNSIPQIVNH